MLERPWDIFYNQSIERILSSSKELLDIGGSLRIAPERNNRLDPAKAWILGRIQELGIAYKVLDYVDTYHPDIVGDIQQLPLADNSQEAVICEAVLEHVEDPIKSARELYRVLKQGGLCLVYVPFLYYYHAEKGYYGDYWRFTDDGLRFLFKPFSTIELCAVRGPLETLGRLTPLGKYKLFQNICYLGDKLTGKLGSKQTSGYFVFLQK